MALPRSSLTSSLALNARVVRYAKSKISTVAVVFAKAAILQLTRRFPAKNSLKSGETTLPQGQNRRAQRLHDQRQAPVRGCFTSRHHHLQGHFSSTKLPRLIEVAQNPVCGEIVPALVRSLLWMACNAAEPDVIHAGVDHLRL